MARASRLPPYWMMPSTNPTQHLDLPSSSGTGSIRSDHKAFDIEVEMARSLITSDPDARPQHFRNLFEECLFVFMVMMATASTTLLQGVIVINTATIGRDLTMTPAQIIWVSASIGLGSGSFMLFFGKTADLFGCKLQLLSGMALLSVTSLATAFVPNPIAMNVLCGFLGLGTAIISPPAIGTLFATYPEGRRRNKATGALGCGNPIGFILGSVSSAVATKYYSWRASFLVIAIFFAIMTVASFWAMPSIPRAGSLRSEVRFFDYLGTVLTIVGMALISAALTEGPELGWKSHQVIIMLLFGAFCLFGFASWENYYRFPLLNPVVWKNKTYTLCILCVFFGYMSFITNLFWISLYMQDVQHLAPLHIAVRLLPQALVGIIWSYIGQALMSKIPGRIIMGIGGIAYLAGATLQLFIKENTSYWMILFPSLCITVIGADFQFIVSNLYISKQMPSQSSLAAGVLQTAMRLSISIGLAITSAVYGSVAQTPKGKADVNLPFERAYLCSIMFAVTGLLFVPFMKIGRQGKKSSPPSITDTTMVDEERPRTAGEYSDRQSTEYRHIISSKPSQTSLWSAATAGSVDSFFPRWSWEAQAAWPDDRYHPKGSNVVCEVCVKCLEERMVVVQNDPRDANRHGYQTQDPNPFRRIDENSYDNPNGRVLDGSLGSSGEAICDGRGNGNGSRSSSETLRTHTGDAVHPTANRVPSRRDPSTDDKQPTFLLPERSTRPPHGDTRMTDARMDPNRLDPRDPVCRVSKSEKGWL